MLHGLFEQKKKKAPWSIGCLIGNVGERSKYFITCCFCWVKREANYADHVLVKFASSLHSSSFPFSCDNSSIPSVEWDACKVDVLSFSLQ